MYVCSAAVGISRHNNVSPLCLRGDLHYGACKWQCLANIVASSSPRSDFPGTLFSQRLIQFAIINEWNVWNVWRTYEGKSVKRKGFVLTATMCPPVMFRICCWLVCSGVMVWCDSGGGGGPTSLMIWLEQISSLRLKFVFRIKWQIRGKVLFKFKSQPMMKSWVKKSKNLCSSLAM